MARRTIISAVLLSLLIFTACSKEERRGLRAIRMTGVADTLVVPDRVVWTLTMNDLDPTLVVAKEANDAKLAAVTAALAKVRLVAGSLRVGSATIERQFRRCDDGVNRFSHFGVRRTVSFHQDDPEAVDEALDILVSAADVEVASYYDLADPEAIMRRLRIRAMDQARGKAAAIADHVGLDLGQITSVNVQEDLSPFRRNQRHDERQGRGAGPQAQYLSTQVNVGFETY
jgi:uncharacterized protein YggE